jgi:GMP synthase-like glutamine amidotransferase
MKIGILQSGHLPPDLVKAHCDYPEMYMQLLDGYGFDFDSYLVVDGEFPASVHQADGWLISGSRHGAYEDLPFIATLEAFIRDAYKAEVPVVGICFGHQIMAKALGGKVEKFSGGWDLGHTDYDFDGRKVTLGAFHQDQVVEAPQDAEVIASTYFCKFAGLAYSGSALSFQPHPEYTPAILEDLIRLRAGQSFTQEQAEQALKRLKDEDDTKRMADEIATFFKKANAAKAA